MVGIPDISGLNVGQLNGLVQDAMSQIELKRNRANTGVVEAKSKLDALIGPDNPTTATINTLTEVQLFTDEQIQANAALGLRLAFRAVEIVARALRDLIVVVGR